MAATPLLLSNINKMTFSDGHNTSIKVYCT